MKLTKKYFILEKKKVISILGSFILLTTLSVNTVGASDVNANDNPNDLNITVEANTIDGEEALDEISAEETKLVPEALISHAGGRIRGKSYTNSKESIDKSYENGYRLIELDFQWTTDGNLALIHDWDGYVNSAFGVESKMYSTEEFKSFNMIEGLTQMTLDDLAVWLYEHKDVHIVTDIKSDNIIALSLIKYRYPNLMDQFIPQIYKLEEFETVQKLGYKNIILTLYMSNYSDDEIIDFIKQHQVFAITMPIARAVTELPKKLKEEDVFVYAHTINSHEQRQELELYEVDGFYTDDILPLTWGIEQVQKAKEYNLAIDNVAENLHQHITREEVCELIVSLYELMSDEKAALPEINEFIDTNNPEVLKANALGIVNGVNETQFSPNANVTREEMAAMLYRTLKKVDEAIVEGKFSISFADEGDISNWALEAVGFLSNHDILSGVGSNRVAPRDSVTREQGIILVKRVFEKFKLDGE